MSSYIIIVLIFSVLSIAIKCRIEWLEGTCLGVITYKILSLIWGILLILIIGYPLVYLFPNILETEYFMLVIAGLIWIVGFLIGKIKKVKK